MYPERLFVSSQVGEFARKAQGQMFHEKNVIKSAAKGINFEQDSSQKGNNIRYAFPRALTGIYATILSSRRSIPSFSKQFRQRCTVRIPCIDHLPLSARIFFPVLVLSIVWPVS